MSSQVEYKKKWYLKNRAGLLQKAKERRETHVDSIKKYKEKYNLENKDKIKHYRKKNILKIREQNRINCKRYRLKNIEKVRNRLREYYQTHYKSNRVLLTKEQKKERIKKYENKTQDRRRFRHRCYAQKRRKQDSTRTTLLKTIQLVYEDNIKKYGTLTCYLCLEPIVFGNDTIEHKIPLSRGGTNRYDNLDIAHRKCNCKKHNKTVEEYQEVQDGLCS